MKNMEDLYCAIKDNQIDHFTLLDVRTAEEYASGHIEGSLNIPHDQITADDISTLRNHQQLVVYCRMGGRATFAGQLLESEGLSPIIIDENGMAYWYEQNYPVVE